MTKETTEKLNVHLKGDVAAGKTAGLMDLDPEDEKILVNFLRDLKAGKIKIVPANKQAKK